MAEARAGKLERYARFALIAMEALAHRMAGRYSRTEGAHLLVKDPEGRILVVRPTLLPGEWTLPGGRVERDETPHRAAARETAEETGMLADVERLLLIDARKHRDVSFIFAGTLRGGALRPQPGEIAAAQFVTRDEIRATSPHLERLLRRIDEAGEGPRYLGLR
ncbi:MAG: NUDIX hydrolase [Chloroflexota bacterium]